MLFYFWSTLYTTCNFMDPPADGNEAICIDTHVIGFSCWCHETRKLHTASFYRRFTQFCNRLFVSLFDFVQVAGCRSITATTHCPKLKMRSEIGTGSVFCHSFSAWDNVTSVTQQNCVVRYIHTFGFGFLIWILL